MKYVHQAFAVAAALTLASAAPSAQQPSPTGQDVPVSSLSQRQLDEEMLKELRQIRQLLERLTQPQPQAPPQPTTAKLTDLKGYMLGKPDAPLTMVEFTDLQCPFCRQYISTTFPQLKKEWIDTGKLRYISRDFPLDFHPQAMNAARAARCAGEQGKFWDMRLTLMTNANLLSPAYITKTAEDLKLDPKAFAACTASMKYDAEIQADEAEGTRIGLNGTPTFVIGRSNGTTLEGPMIVGAMPYSVFDARLKQLLGK